MSNTAPLGAFPGYGEVKRTRGGLEKYGMARVFDSLKRRFYKKKKTPLDVKAQYFRMTLGLIIAHRRPEFYFVYDKNALDAKTDEYLKILRRQLVIGDDLYRASPKITAFVSKHLSGNIVPTIVAFAETGQQYP
jgi:hypothetical protein